MLSLPINTTDSELRNQLDNIYQNAQGTIIELSGVPTATAPLLNANEWGTYSNVLYIRVGNTILVITPSSTITVT